MISGVSIKVDYWTYCDTILTQIRAICSESKNFKKNHTIQIYFKNIGDDDIANEINKYFHQKIGRYFFKRSNKSIS